ncbi:MAG: hypothetical protein KIT11_05670 [Fimbriimonadaceae bacterium]|nr:hypothetical protein [Fimbriimonadaceae bacterium]QYK56618.1 MAG: hypothetical protein KF733_03845 [Fimbriimonadaceae bacterium]
MTQSEAMEYLRATRRRFTRYLVEGRLHRDKETGLFARSEVERLADEIVRRIIADDEAEVGRSQSALGSQRGLGQVAKVVP